MLKGAKILVAGGTGFLGINLMHRLVVEEAIVRATHHERSVKFQDPAIEYVLADLTRLDDCQKVAKGMDYVFMCAANTSGAAVMISTPLAHVTPNVVMNAQMLQASYEAGVKKFLFISSSAVYPPTGDQYAREENVWDGEPYEVYYSVAWMKRYTEILCRIYAEKIKKPMATVVVRPSNVYGPYAKFDFQKAHMQHALIRKVIERHDPIEVWGTGADVRDLIYVDDFIEGLLLAFQYPQNHLVVNIASGTGCSVKAFLQRLLVLEGHEKAKICFDPSKPSTIPIRLVDIGLARKLLGFQPKFSLDQGLRRTIEWYRLHGAGDGSGQKGQSGLA